MTVVVVVVGPGGKPQGRIRFVRLSFRKILVSIFSFRKIDCCIDYLEVVTAFGAFGMGKIWPSPSWAGLHDASGSWSRKHSIASMESSMSLADLSYLSCNLKLPFLMDGL